MRDKVLLGKIILTVSILSLFDLHVQAQSKSNSTTPGLSSPRTLTDSATRSKVTLPMNIAVPVSGTTTSIQSLDHDNLIKYPVSNVLNTLPGRIAGLYTYQASGQPGADVVSLTLRGRTPLVLIDGIPRSLTGMDLEEVESVTVLKDAMSTAMLGVRGANGAILITTRQGSSKRQEISFTAQTAFQQPIGLLKPLSAYDYATLYNEASGTARYSAADLAAYQAQSDPLGHPDINWYDQVLKSNAPLNRYTLTASGGNASLRYFTTVEHLFQDGLFQTSDINNYNTNEYLSRYLVRSNVDVNITPQLTAGIHLLGSISNENQPGVTSATIFNSLLTTPNNAYPVFNSNGSYGGTPTYTNNIEGQATGSGYQQNYTRNILADFYLNRMLNEVTPGLYVKAALSYTSTVNENINRSKPVVAYQQTGSGSTATYGPALATSSPQINTNTISATTGVAGLGQYRQSYAELSAGWDRTFNGMHSFDVQLMANSDSKNDGANLPYTIQGIAAHASYRYKQKYTVELAGAYNGSNYYPGGDHFQYGFFPVGGLAWDISKEDFLKPYASWLNLLKLSANYGYVGNDNPGYFVYLQRYNNAATPYFGTSVGANTSLAEGTLANPNITFEKAHKLNISLQGLLLKEKLGFTIDYYNNQFFDLLIQRGQNTSLIGNTYPNENIGRNQYTGVDLQLSWQQTVGNSLHYYLALNGGLQQSKVIYNNEAAQPYPWMQRTGQKAGQAFGYVAAGLYQDQADINNAHQNGYASVFGYSPVPGDIKYVDQNGDGIINQFDQVPVGPTGPLITYGANVGFSYKGFDVSALFQGVANYSVYLSGNSYWEFQSNGNGQAYQQQLGRFTAATAATATYPRLSIGTNVNNDTFSTYWFRPADYIRLKNVQIGYTFPDRYAKAIKMRSLRIFANGTNLFTATKLTDGLDPEDYNGVYPIQRLLNLGITVKL